MTDHADVVARVKDALVAAGVNIAGACGAFEITRRVLWELRAEGWGYLQAPVGGENCHGFRTDKAVRPGGSFVDCLVDAGGANTPAWQLRAATPDEIAAFRPLVDPGPLPLPVTPAPGDPPPPPGDPRPPMPPAPPTPAPEPEDPPFVELLGELKAIEAKLEAATAGENTLSGALGHLQATIDRLAVTGIRLHF